MQEVECNQAGVEEMIKREVEVEELRGLNGRGVIKEEEKAIATCVKRDIWASRRNSFNDLGFSRMGSKIMYFF